MPQKKKTSTEKAKSWAYDAQSSPTLSNKNYRKKGNVKTWNEREKEKFKQKENNER